MTNPHAVNVYTDGSVARNLKSSGQGIVICYPDGEEREILEYGYKNSTIIRRELGACIEALRSLRGDSKAKGISQICIHSDSQHVVNNYRYAINGVWQGRGWMTMDGNDVDNQDLWKDLFREFKKAGKRVEILKVKAHSGNIHNEKADNLAAKSRDMPFKNDFASERKQIRRWLPIPEVKLEIKLKNSFIVYIQRTDPRKKLFEAHVQVLRPKKYRGVRIKIRGELDKDALRAAHLYIINLVENKKALIIKNAKDLGRSSENKAIIQ